MQGYGLAISARKEGMKWWNQGSLRRHKCNIRRISILESLVYIGWLVPPLERLERREEPKAQGGEFVEAYVAKRTKQISYEEKPLQEEFCRW